MFKGISTEPDVRKLRESFGDLVNRRGDLIRHEEIEAILGLDRKANRYKTVVNKWRKEVEVLHGVVVDGRGEAIGKGYMILLDSEQLKFGVKQRESARRRVKRWHRSVSHVNEANLTPAEKAVRNHEMKCAAVLHATLLQGQEQSKEIRRLAAG